MPHATGHRLAATASQPRRHGLPQDGRRHSRFADIGIGATDKNASGHFA
jgi:hypothetical protein